LFLNVRVRRKILEGEDIVGGETDDGGGIDGAGQFASGPEHWLQRFCGSIVGDDHDYRLFCGPGHERQVECPRRGGEPGDTSPPRTKAQVPSYAIKARRVLQLRKNLADKRENHEVLV
jgi:hypothetical protein